MRTTTGPGDYDPKTWGSSQSILLFAKPGEKSFEELQRIPGPGTYEDKRDSLHLKYSVGYKIGTEKRKSNFLLNSSFQKPGPGIKDSIFVDKQTAPSFGFGTSKREKDYLGLRSNTKTLPGPGDYKIPTRVARVPKYSGTKHDTKFKFV